MFGHMEPPSASQGGRPLNNDDHLLDLVLDVTYQEQLSRSTLLGSFVGKKGATKTFLKSVLFHLWSTYVGWSIEELKKRSFSISFQS